MSLNKIAAVHQPNYLPWIGYFHKILKSDFFIFLDHVEYSRRSFINRNRVKGPRGAVWLTVPVKVKDKERIMDVKIDNTQDWQRKHALTLTSFYGKAPYFNDIFPSLKRIYEEKWVYLVDMNVELIKTISEILNLHENFVFSHTLNLSYKKMDLIIELCEKVGADTYFSGAGARKYQNEEYFKKNGINLIYQNINPPKYPQRFGEFIPNLSIVDILFNIGPEKTKEIIMNL